MLLTVKTKRTSILVFVKKSFSIILLPDDGKARFDLILIDKIRAKE